MALPKRSSDGTLFGERRLFDALAQCDRQPTGAIAAVSPTWRNSRATQADDLTLLVLRWHGASARRAP
jgi:hypothetical protein